MKIFKTKHKLQKEILNMKNITFVPTMGGLHKGHISLIRKSKTYKGLCLVSVFVNPKQFNENKDFISYPRDIKKDLKILNKLKVDFVFIPKNKEIFSFKTKKKIFLDKTSKILCGKFRKGHFLGVVNVVNRFLDIISPKYLFLGLKDFQQFYLINKHIEKRGIKTKVIPCKIIREKSGIPLSTRNDNIQKSQLNVASKVYRYLKSKKKKIKKNLKYFDLSIFKKDLLELGVEKIDYIEIYNINNLNKPKRKNENFKIFIAYYLDKVRLIDNV